MEKWMKNFNGGIIRTIASYDSYDLALNLDFDEGRNEKLMNYLIDNELVTQVVEDVAFELADYYYENGSEMNRPVVHRVLKDMLGEERYAELVDSTDGAW